MIPTMQTLFPTDDDQLRGNCFAACLASVLELSLDEVPHVMQHDDWRDRTNTWLATLGFGTVEVVIDIDEACLYPLPAGMLVVVTGATGRHPSRLHSVVARTIEGGVKWEYLHDPHPGGGFLTRATHLMWVVPLDPASALGAMLAEQLDQLDLLPKL